MAEGDNWNEDEITVACYVYLFSDKITVKEKRLVSSMLGRTEKSVAAKIDNLKRFDEEAIRNGSYWAHGSHLDGIVWNKFQNNPEHMVDRARDIILKSGLIDYQTLDFYYPVVDPVVVNIDSEMERATMIKAWMGRNSFRKSVLQASDYKCCITGTKYLPSLVASRIKPWSACSPEERIDIHNTLCLNSLHYSLFNRYLMTIDNDGNIIYSLGLKKRFGNDFFESSISKYDKITVMDNNRPYSKYIKYHNSRFEEETGEFV